MRKMFFNRGTLVPATAIYQKKCPFTVLSALFLFFRTLPCDSGLFPGNDYQHSKISSIHKLIPKIQQILGSHELKGHGHF